MENILEVKKLSKKYDGFEFKNTFYFIINCNNKCRTFFNKIITLFMIHFLPFLNSIYIQT